MNDNENMVVRKLDIQDNPFTSSYQEESRKREVLDKYEKAMEKREVINLEFSLVAKNGDMYLYEEGVKVCLPAKESIKVVRPGFGIDHELLSKKYRLCVSSVDRENEIIYMGKSDEERALRESIEVQIKDAIASGEGILVPAEVVSVRGRDNIVVVDIAGLGIPGFIRIANWSTAFTKRLDYETKQGDMVKVVVTGTFKWRTGMMYECSRKLALTEDPWKDIEKKVARNTTVKVLCTDTTDKAFFGRIQGIDEVNCYCEYPDDPTIRIAPGIKYTGYVVKVSEEKQIIRIRITGYSGEGPEAM